MIVPRRPAVRQARFQIPARHPDGDHSIERALRRTRIRASMDVWIFEKRVVSVQQTVNCAPCKLHSTKRYNFPYLKSDANCPQNGRKLCTVYRHWKNVIKSFYNTACIFCFVNCYTNSKKEAAMYITTAWKPTITAWSVKSIIKSALAMIFCVKI